MNIILETLTITNYVSTGVKGADAVLGGKGIPRGSIVFVLGVPGGGKTTFAFQYLIDGIINHGEKGVYISLDENTISLEQNALSVGLDLKKHIDNNNLKIVNVSPLSPGSDSGKFGKVTVGKSSFSLVSLIDTIGKNVRELSAKRLVIDPVATLVLYYPNLHERRTAVLDLMREITSTECTTLLISELSTSKLEREYQFEEYLSHGVILLRKLSRPGGVIRVFSVEKMRGVEHDTQLHPYKIGEGGIEVFSSEIAL